jgi:hypothetical protein
MTYGIPGPAPGDSIQPGQIPQYPPQGQWGQYDNYPGYGTYLGPSGQYAPPRDHRIWVTATVMGGVLFSLLIGMPLGLVALRNSRRVKTRMAAGDYQGAVKASRSARAWAIAATAFDVLGFIVVTILIAHGSHPAT